MISVLTRDRKRRDAQRHRGAGPVRTEAEARVMQPQAGALTIARSYQEPRERHGPDSSSEPPERTNPDKILISDFWPIELWDNKFLSILSQSLW